MPPIQPCRGHFPCRPHEGENAAVTMTLEQTLGFLAANPAIATMVVIAAAVVGLARRRSRAAPEQKDPIRAFSTEQRRLGFARADRRCELDGPFWTRCRRPASHGDHHIPWSRGGATDLDNFVAACQRCNTSKGARIPTLATTLRVQWRRRRYFPPGVSRRPGTRW